MKKILLFLAAILLVTELPAQGKSKDKSKDKAKEKSQAAEKKNKTAAEYTKHENSIWEGTRNGGAGPKPSKNQPAKVRAAFQRDYPHALNVRWSKYRGDWTATFGNGPFLSTAVYHANGDRRDTRTPILRPQLPPIILDDIFKKRPRAELGDIIKIEVPQGVKDIFRIKTLVDGVSKFLFYNADGQEVQYDY